MDRLYFPEFDTPETNHGVAEGLDGEAARQMYGRVSFGGFSFTGALGERERDVPTASFGTISNEHLVRQRTTDRHTVLSAEYRRSFGRLKLSARTSLNEFSYDGYYPFGVDDSSPPLVAHDQVIGTRWTSGVRLAQQITRRQTITGGVEFVDNIRQNQRSSYIDPRPEIPERIVDTPGASTQYAVFVQDEVRVAPWLLVNGGIRYDEYETFGRLSPRTALIVMPTGRQSFKYLFGSAFRAPNAYESTPSFFGPGVEDLVPESIDTHELVWEQYTGDWLRTSVSSYWYRAHDLITMVPDDSTFLGGTFVNQGDVRAGGVELEGQVRFAGGAQALVSYAVQRTEDHETHLTAVNSPRHLAKGRFTVPGLTAGASFSGETRYMSSRATVRGGHVPGVVTVDLSAVQPLGRSWSLTAAIRNVLDADYADPASSSHRQDAIPQNGRQLRVGLVWKFWDGRQPTR